MNFFPPPATALGLPTKTHRLANVALDPFGQSCVWDEWRCWWGTWIDGILVDGGQNFLEVD